MTDAIVIILVSLSAVSGTYALICSIRRDSLAIQAVKKARKIATEAWNDLNWVLKKMLYPEATLKVLMKKIADPPPDLIKQYQAVRQLSRRMMWALVVCSISIAVVLVGTKLLGWQW